MNKNKLTKKMISLLCAILLTFSTILTYLPSEVFASADTTPPTDFTEISWTDFTGLSYQTYTAPNPDGTPNAKGNYSGGLNRTLLNSDIVIGKGVDIRYAGAEGWNGLRINVVADSSMSYLSLESNGFGTVTSGNEYLKLYPASELNTDTVVDKQFNLKISTEISGNSYTFGVWVNNVMLGGYITMEANSGVTGNYVGFYAYEAPQGNVTLAEATLEVPDEPVIPEPILPPTDFTEISWTDFAGLAYQEYVAPNPDGAPNAKGAYSAGLNKTILNGDIVIGKGVDIRYAGAEGWNGLRINVVADSSMSYLSLESNGFGTVTSGNEYLKLYPASELNTDTVVDKQFNLKISTEISGNSYTFGVWVNNVMLGGYITMEANSGVTGNYVGFYAYEAPQGNVTLAEATLEVPDEPVIPEPILPPTDFTEISWTDFAGLAYQEYVAPNPDGTPNAKGTYAESLNRTLLNGNIIMGYDVDMRYAGSNGWAGLIIRTLTDGTLYVENSTYDTAYNGTYQPSDYGLTSFIDEEFNLKISTEIDGNNYTFGIWVNDIMLGDYFTLTETADAEKGSVVGFYHRGSSKNITLLEVPEDNPPIDPDEPTTLPPTDFTEISWTDFSGLAYQEYVAPNPDGTPNAKGTYAESLNRTLLNGNIIMGYDVDMRYAGSNGWAGLIIRTLTDGTLYVENSTYDTAYNGTYQPSDYGLTSFIDEEFNLKISTEIDGNNYTFGIWVNDIMLGDYFTLTETADAEKGSVVGFYHRGSSKNITLLEVESETPPVDPDEPDVPVIPDEPDEPILPPTDLTELGWTDFTGFDYQEYPAKAGDLASKGTYLDTLNGTLLNGDIIFGAGTDMRYAGNDGWQGLIIFVMSDGSLNIDAGTFGTVYNKVYYASDYGLTSFANTEFNLKISTEIDGDDYTFGVWVNDQMLGDYFTLAKGECITGSTIGLYDRGSGNGFELIGEPVAEEPILPPTTFTELAWSSFGLQCKEFPAIAGNLATKGIYQGDLHQTLLSGDITFGSGTDFRYGGNDGWQGFLIIANPDGTLSIENGTFGTAFGKTFMPADFGLESFVGTEFNLKISTEINGDKYTFGIWVNDQMLGNYLTLAKGECNTGTAIGLYDRGTGNSITLSGEPIKEVDSSASLKPDSSLKEITFSSFGMEDADFTDINVLTFCSFGSYYDLVKGKTLDGTLFHGKVKFSENGDTELRIGGTTSAWLGLRITGIIDGSIMLTEAEQNAPEKQFTYLFSPYLAGCELVGEWLDLKLSIQFVDHDGDGAKDDVKLGFWFNDVLYQNEFIYLVDYVQHMGSYMSVYSYNANSHISIRSVEVDDTIDLGMFGFDDSFRSYFKDAVKETVKGKPLGVTAEYDTVDYTYNTKGEAADNNTDDKVDVEQTKTLPIGMIAVVGTGLLLVLLLCMLLLARKKKIK